MKPDMRIGKRNWQNRKTKQVTQFKDGNKGRPLKLPRYCWNCGKRPKDEAHKCKFCGGMVMHPDQWIYKKQIDKAKFYQRFQ